MDLLHAVCGGINAQVTLCFPGSPEEATCVYNIISNYTPGDLSTSTELRSCPMEPLFGEECYSLPGTLNIAYGPCNSYTPGLPQNATNTLPVSEWLDVLGMNSLKVLLLAKMRCTGIGVPASSSK